MAETPSKLEDVETPAVIIREDLVKANIKKSQDYADKHGFKLRPHIKTHKIAEFAQMQLDAGAHGINCQKLSEAEVMAARLAELSDNSSSHGSLDLLITFNIIGKEKLARLAKLAHKVKLTVVADSEYTIKGYADAAHSLTGDDSLGVLIECDMGGLRAGVTTPEEAVELAKTIKKLDNGENKLLFKGLLTYPAAGPKGTETLGKWLVAANQAFDAAGIALPSVSVGGTPDMWTLHEVNEVTKKHTITEQRPGTYIYMDRACVRSNAATFDECAQTVLSTVVSRPTSLRAICDAGSKALSSDLLGMEGHGRIIEFPNARISRLSEEHGVIEADKEEDLPPIGARIRIIPNHACTVTNLFDRVILVNNDDGAVVKTLPIIARGCVI